jgi:flavodoxin
MTGLPHVISSCNRTAATAAEIGDVDAAPETRNPSNVDSVPRATDATNVVSGSGAADPGNVEPMPETTDASSGKDAQQSAKPKLLIVYHTQFGATAQMAKAAYFGAQQIDDVDVVLKHASDSGADDLLECAALIVCTSENFGSLCGMVKDFLERVYYPCEQRVEGKAYTVIVCASNDGTGAMLQTDRIATGLKLRKVHPGTIYKSGIVAQPHTVPDATLRLCEEIGATLAAGVAAHIF